MQREPHAKSLVAVTPGHSRGPGKRPPPAPEPIPCAQRSPPQRRSRGSSPPPHRGQVDSLLLRAGGPSVGASGQLLLARRAARCQYLLVEPVAVDRAVTAASLLATEAELTVDHAVLVQNSNKLALRLLPCDVLARVAVVGQDVAALELEVAQRLADTQSPVASLDAGVKPRVYERDGFAVTFWTYYELRTADELLPVQDADALQRCTRVCEDSTSRPRTSRSESRKPRGWSPTDTKRRCSLKPIGNCSCTRCREHGGRSLTEVLPSNCYTANRIQATFSARTTARCSSTSKRVAVGQSNSMLRTCRITRVDN